MSCIDKVLSVLSHRPHATFATTKRTLLLLAPTRPTRGSYSKVLAMTVVISGPTELFGGSRAYITVFVRFGLVTRLTEATTSTRRITERCDGRGLLG